LTVECNIMQASKEWEFSLRSGGKYTNFILKHTCPCLCTTCFSFKGLHFTSKVTPTRWRSLFKLCWCPPIMSWRFSE